MTEHNEARINVTLNETLKAAKLSRNALAVKAGIRTSTISDLCNGKSKAINFETLLRIVDALNTLDTNNKRHTMDDVICIDYDFSTQELTKN